MNAPLVLPAPCSAGCPSPVPASRAGAHHPQADLLTRLAKKDPDLVVLDVRTADEVRGRPRAGRPQCVP